MMKIRLFRAADASGLAEWIDQLAPAEEVYTEAMLRHYRGMLPRWHQPLWLVAVVDGQPVGLGRDEPQLFGRRPGLRRTWIGVRPDLRGQGVGSQLWQRIENHARKVGGLTLRSWSVANVPEAERFLLARGFTRVRRELQWWIDPTSVNAQELERLTARARREGFDVRPLRALLPTMESALTRIFLDADEDTPGRGPTPPRVGVSTFRRVILSHPQLDQDCSTVVLRDGEPVALSWLKGDRSVGRYGVEFTGTDPAWRGHGLATLAKMAALHRVARAGVRWVGTANADDNAPMLAINRKLKHQPLPDLLVYERPPSPPET